MASAAYEHGHTNTGASPMSGQHRGATNSRGVPSRYCHSRVGSSRCPLAASSIASEPHQRVGPAFHISTASLIPQTNTKRRLQRASPPARACAPDARAHPGRHSASGHIIVRANGHLVRLGGTEDPPAAEPAPPSDRPTNSQRRQQPRTGCVPPRHHRGCVHALASPLSRYRTGRASLQEKAAIPAGAPHRHPQFHSQGDTHAHTLAHMLNIVQRCSTSWLRHQHTSPSCPPPMMS